METSLPTPYLPGTMLIYWRVSWWFASTSGRFQPRRPVPAIHGPQEAADEAEFLLYLSVRGTDFSGTEREFEKNSTRMGRYFICKWPNILGCGTLGSKASNLEVPYVPAEPYFRNNNKWGYSYTFIYIYIWIYMTQSNKHWYTIRYIQDRRWEIADS